MVTEQGTAPASDESGYVSMADFRAFQSASDAKMSSVQRDLSESEAIISELNADLTGARDEVRQLRTQGYAEHSPEMVEALKERDDLRERVRKAEGMVKQSQPHLRQSTAEAMAWRFSQGNQAEANRAFGELMQARNLREMEVIERKLYADAKPIPAPTVTGDEVDAGRGGGRGAGSRITQARIAEIRASGDTKAWEEISDDYWKMLAAGKPIPER